MENKKLSFESKKLISFIVAIFLVLGIEVTSLAADINVSSVTALNIAVSTVNPGDRIILSNGEYKDLQLVVNRSGNESNLIYIMAQNPGKVSFTGNVKVELRGQYIVLQGISFVKGNRNVNQWATHGPGLVAMYNSYNRVTNCLFDGFDDANSAWVTTSLTSSGFVPKYCRIDHCSFINKITRDQVINLNNTPNTLTSGAGGAPMYHRVDHNFFSNFPKDGNAGGGIRIGYYRNDTGRCLIDSNLFVRQDSEPEIITSKSQENVMYANTFINCQGTMNFRHGDHQVAINNFFLGTDTKFQYGGMFVWGSKHVIACNYFALNRTLNSRGNSALYLNPGAVGTEHALAYNILIGNNHIINTNGHAIHFNPLDAQRKQQCLDSGWLFKTPHNINILGNVIYSNISSSFPFLKNDYYGDSQNVWSNNLAYQRILGIPSNPGINEFAFTVNNTSGIFRPDISVGYNPSNLGNIDNITGINLDLTALANQGISGSPFSLSDLGVKVGAGWITSAPQYALSGQTDFDLIIQNVIAEQKRGLNTNSTSLNSAITTLINNMNSNGSFSDISYTTDDAYTTHLTRLRQMSLAYTFTGATYFNSITLYNKIVSGLQFWNASNYVAVNWYANQIGYPQLLGQTLILMRGSSGTTQLPAVDENIAIDYLSTRLDPSSNTGANRVDEALHWIYRGALTQSSVALNNALVNIQSTMIQVPKGVEGINPDNAFLQHNQQLMTQSYGSEFLNSVYDAGLYLKGTSYLFAQSELDVVFRFAHESYYGAARGKYKDFNLDGRGISRANNSLMTSNIARKGKAVDVVHATDFNNDSLRITEAQPPNYNLATPYHIHYWTGDYTLHKRPGYSFSVRTNSTRTIKTESLNGENLLGKWLSDGGTSIRISGGEYYNIFPVWDWNKVPGITMRQFATQQTNTNGTNSYGSTVFVGGVSDSSYGASTYHQNNGSVIGRKSWFFFDNEIVCLGAGITCSQPENVATTLNQTLLNGSVTVKSGGVITALPTAIQQTYSNNLNWVLHNNVGYFFPTGGNVTVSNQSQSGSWSSIGTGSSNTVTADVFKLWLNHGSTPSNASYAYIVAPGVSNAIQMDAYNISAIQILSNTASIQAVQHTGLNMLQIIFSSAGTLNISGTEVSSVTVDKPCALLLKNINTSSPTISIADPAQQNNTINLTLTFLSSPTKNFVCDMPTGDLKGSSKLVASGQGNGGVASFTPGIIAVVRIGGENGNNGLTGSSSILSAGSPVHIDKYSVSSPTSFTYQNSIDLPATGTNKIFMSASQNEGYILQSSNKQWLSVMGYGSTGSGTVYNTTTNPGITRVLGLIKYDGSINLTTALNNFPVSGTSATVQAAISTNGNDLWCVTGGGNSGAMGVLHTKLGTTDASAPPSVVVSTTIANNKSLGIFGGDLYYAANSGNRIGTVSASGGLPFITGNTMTSFSVASGSTAFSSFSPSQIVMFDMEPNILGFDVMYVTNSSTSAGLAGIYKYCKNASGEWVSFGSYGLTTTDGSYFGITGNIVDGLPVLYVTRGITSNTTVSSNQIIQLIEANGYNATMSATLAAVTDATISGKAGTIRGIAFFPTPSFYYKGVGNINELSSWGTNTDGTGTAPTTFTAPDQTFFITNGTNATFSGDLSVGGVNSKIVLGDGTNATTLNVPSAFSINGQVDVYNNASLNIQNEQLPTLQYMARNSTINYSAVALQNIIPMAYGNLSNNNNSTARIDGTVSISNSLIQNGFLQGQGTLNVPNGFTNNGTIAPGNGVGLLSINGNFTNAASAKINIELGGNATAGTDYDQLSINGNVSINGTLNIVKYAGFNPQIGNVFTILTGTTITGSFGTINWPSGLSGSVIYNSSSVQILITSTTLPLTLLDFSGSLLQNNEIQLLWKTVNEDNVAYFEIECSNNAQDFNKVDTKTAVGLGNNSYKLTLINRGKDLQYYRLKIVDKDGKYYYSSTIIIKMNVQHLDILSIFPNPAKNKITVSHEKASLDSYLKLMSLDGRIVSSFKVLPGNTQTRFSLNELLPATYILIFENNGTTTSKKFIKM